MTCTARDTQDRHDGPLHHDCGEDAGHPLPHTCGQEGCGHRWPEPVDKQEMALEALKSFVDLCEAPTEVMSAAVREDYDAMWVQTLAKAKVALDPTDIYEEPTDG